MERRLEHLRRNRSGQIAIAFLVLIGAMLIMASVMMNAGEVATLKTSTSNAAETKHRALTASPVTVASAS